MKNQLKKLIPFFILIMIMLNCFFRIDVSRAATFNSICDPDLTNSHFKSNKIHLNINLGIEINVKKITFNASFYIITLYIKGKPEYSSILTRYFKFSSKKHKPISS